MDPLELGLAAVELGAGRTRAEQAIDHAVGLVLRATKGTRVEAGQPLVEVHARTDAAADAICARVRDAFVIGDATVARGPLVFEAIRSAPAR